MSEGFGYFGKIPARGDFLRKGLSPDFVQPWDRWAQQFLLTGRETLGEHWQETYFSAPIWRFALNPGLCGPSSVVGVLMPSVDRVGRQFPLTLAMECEPSEAWDAYASATRCFAGLEDAALAMLDDSADPDWLEDRLRALTLDAAQAAARIVRVGRGFAVKTRSSVPDALAQAFLADHVRPGSIWVCELDGAQHFLSCAAMPGTGTEIKALLDLEATPWSDQHQFEVAGSAQ